MFRSAGRMAWPREVEQLTKSCIWRCTNWNRPLATSKESEGVKMVVDRRDPLPVASTRSPRSTGPAVVGRAVVGESSVGVIGGAPKMFEDLAGPGSRLSVATGTACLGRYAVPRSGPVLSIWPRMLENRAAVEGMARHGTALLAWASTIHGPYAGIDRAATPAATTRNGSAAMSPLLLLDPLVRLHRAGRE